MATPSATGGQSTAAQLNGSPQSKPIDYPTSEAVYLGAEKAAEIDQALMGDRYGFTLHQLMELAGLAVAYAVADYAPRLDTASICIVCGPGNNGGDGLVAARHLKLFGYQVCAWYPKVVTRSPFEGLVKQLQGMQVEFVDEIPNGVSIVVDAVFGFSFIGGSVRDPFVDVLDAMNACKADVVAVDVPSGWDVNEGAIGDWAKVESPACVISLTGPKKCMREIDRGGQVVHYVGGRFVPERLRKELSFSVVDYPGIAAVVRVV